jgi:hypothetical protein
MSETSILIRLLRMYFAQNWEYGLALSKLRNFGCGFEPPPSVRHWSELKQNDATEMGYEPLRKRSHVPRQRARTNAYPSSVLHNMGSNIACVIVCQSGMCGEKKTEKETVI